MGRIGPWVYGASVRQRPDWGYGDQCGEPELGDTGAFRHYFEGMAPGGHPGGLCYLDMNAEFRELLENAREAGIATQGVPVLARHHSCANSDLQPPLRSPRS